MNMLHEDSVPQIGFCVLTFRRRKLLPQWNTIGVRYTNYMEHTSTAQAKCTAYYVKRDVTSSVANDVDTGLSDPAVR